MSALRTPRVAISGAGMSGIGMSGIGMSGIGMAAKLRMAGIESFQVYERSDGIGGTWHANTYPGLECDIPSRYYQYRFAPNPDWTHVYSPGAEIRDYIRRVADDFGIRDRTSFGACVSEIAWIDGGWRVRTSDGDEQVYDFVVAATGGWCAPTRRTFPACANSPVPCSTPPSGTTPWPWRAANRHGHRVRSVRAAHPRARHRADRPRRAARDRHP